jgi:hypothetical protein
LKTFIPFHFCFLLFFSSFPLTLFAQSPGDCILIPDIHFNSSSQISVHVTDIYSDDGSSHSAFFPENLPGNLALCPDQSATFVAFISSNAGYVLGDPGPLFPQNLDITWTLKNDTGSVLLQSPLQSFTGPLILSSTTEFLLDSSLLSSLPFGDYSVTISAIAQPPTGFPPSCVDFHLLSLSSTFLFHLIHVTSITATLSGQPLQNPASLTSDQLQPFFLTALLDPPVPRQFSYSIGWAVEPSDAGTFNFFTDPNGEQDANLSFLNAIFTPNPSFLGTATISASCCSSACPSPPHAQFTYSVTGLNDCLQNASLNILNLTIDSVDYQNDSYSTCLNFVTISAQIEVEPTQITSSSSTIQEIFPRDGFIHWRLFKDAQQIHEQTEAFTGTLPSSLNTSFTLNLDQAGVYFIGITFSAQSPGDFSHLNPINCSPLAVDTANRFYADPKQLTLSRIELQNASLNILNLTIDSVDYQNDSYSTCSNFVTISAQLEVEPTQITSSSSTIQEIFPRDGFIHWKLFKDTQQIHEQTEAFTGTLPSSLNTSFTLNLDQAGVYSVALSFSAKSPGDFSHLATNCNPLPVDTEGRFYAEPKQLTLYRIEIAGIVVDFSIPAGVQNGQAFLKGSLDSIDFSVQWNPADIDTNDLPNLVTWTLIPTNQATLTTLLNNKARLESINPAYTGAITVKAECYSSQAEFTVHIFDGYVVSIQYPYPNRMWCKGDTHPFGGSVSVLLEANLSPGLLTSPSYDHAKIIWSLSQSSVGLLTPVTGDHRLATFEYLPASPYVSMVEGDIQITARYDITPFAPPLELTVYEIVNVKWETFINPIDDNKHPILDDPTHPDYARARTWDNLYNPPVAGQEDKPPLWGGGKRIYPDKNAPTDSLALAEDQRLVKLEIEMQPSTVSDLPLYLKVFDVDDPTQSRHFFRPSTPGTNFFYEARFIDDNDAYSSTGRVHLPRGGDNRGKLADYGLYPSFAKEMTVLSSAGSTTQLL